MKGCCRLKLYEKCFRIENVKTAIKKVLKSEGSKTAGPDGINRYSDISEERYIKEIKLRLRKYVKVNSRQVVIPKENGNKRIITIINLFDRMAQEVVYDQINPIVEQHMSYHSYGFRQGINQKVPVAKIANVIRQIKETYTIEIDFEKCFNNIPLEKALDSLRTMGIKDGKLIATIKHLMYTSREYNGIGISQGTILGPILCNCYLNKLDRFMENEFEVSQMDHHYSRDYQKHQSEWIEWNQNRSKKITCRYFRYADDTVIICRNESEQQYIFGKVREFINKDLDIQINQDKIVLGVGEVHFLGFKLAPNQRSIWITMDKPRKYLDELKRFKFNTIEECRYFLKWFRGVLNYFDIVNDMAEFIKKVGLRLYYRSKDSQLHKITIADGKKVYEFGSKDNLKQPPTIIDIWELRKITKLSFKEYLVNNTWLTLRESLKSDLLDKTSSWGGFKWLLYTKQKGRDAITGDNLLIKTMIVHHIKPRAKGGKNEINNMILINETTHKELHYGETKGKYERYRKHLR